MRREKFKRGLHDQHLVLFAPYACPTSFFELDAYMKDQVNKEISIAPVHICIYKL